MSAEGDFGIVAIVGVGLIGGSLGMALRGHGLCRTVVGIGRNPQRLQKAVALGAVDRFTTDMADGISGADTIVLCTPVSKIIADLPSVLAVAGHHALITDVGSVKAAIVAAAAGDARFVGGHPMAGSELTGVEAARPTLFQDATWAITPHPATPDRATERIKQLAMAVGANVHVMTPEVHDSAVAVTSHLPHVTAAAYMRLAAAGAARNPALSAMTAGSFADATRIAASSPALWRDICLANREALLASIDSLTEELLVARKLIASGDSDGVHDFFARSAKAKADWPSR